MLGLKYGCAVPNKVAEISEGALDPCGQSFGFGTNGVRFLAFGANCARVHGGAIS